MDRMAIPHGVSFSGLLNILAAWNRARGHESVRATKEVAAQIGSAAKFESNAKVVSK